MNANITKLPLEAKKIRLQKSPINLPNNIEIYPISYNSRDKPLIIQTPRLYLPFGISTLSFSTSGENDDECHEPSQQNQSNRKCQLHLSLESPKSHSMKEFIQHINQIDTKLKMEYENYYFNSTIRQSRDPTYPPFMRVKIPSRPNPRSPPKYQVFDLSNNIQPQDYIIPGSWATSLIHPKHLWVNNQTCQVGITWTVLQSKIKTPIPQLPIDRCLIDDPWEDETFCAICYAKVIRQVAVQGVEEEEQQPLPQEYEKYTKMLKLGIPILAIIQRCQMDGLDPEILRNRHKSKISVNLPKSSIPLPPPPPASNQTTKPLLGGQPRLLFSKDDLLNSKSLLGKREIKVKKVKTLCLRKRDPRVPSLHMILSSRNNLRSTRKPADFESDVK